MLLLDLPDDFHPTVEAVGCFVESEGEILLLRRQDHKSEPDTYGVPAGKMEPGEGRDAAIRRETLEETGITLGEITYFRTVGVRYSTHESLYHIYHARLDHRPEVRINPEEHKSYIWRTPEMALREPLMQDGDTCIGLFYGIWDTSDAEMRTVSVHVK